MRLLVSLALFALAPALASAETFVYVSVAGDKRIAVYQMDADGKLTHKGDAKTDGEPGALVALSPGAATAGSVDVAPRPAALSSMRSSSTGGDDW